MLVGALLAAWAGPAAARHAPRDTTRIRVGTIDVGGVHIEKGTHAKHPMHLRGNVDVDGKHVQFDDTLDVHVPRLSHSFHHKPGIHIHSDDASIVRLGTDIEIDSTEVVDDAVVALFGNITVRGRVGGDVVAVLGSVRLEPGSVVDGDAVAIGG